MAATALLHDYPYAIVSGMSSRISPSLTLERCFRAAAEKKRDFFGFFKRDGWSSEKDLGTGAAEEILRGMTPNDIEAAAHYLTCLFDALHESFSYRYNDVRIHSIAPNREGRQDSEVIVGANLFHTDRAPRRPDRSESFMLLHTLDGGSHDRGTEIADVDEKLYEYLLSKDEEMRGYRERWGKEDSREETEGILRRLSTEIDREVPQSAIVSTRTYDSMILRLSERPTFHRAPRSDTRRLLLIIDNVTPLG